MGETLVEMRFYVTIFGTVICFVMALVFLSVGDVLTIFGVIFLIGAMFMIAVTYWRNKHRCPGCRRLTESSWFVCPHCGYNLRLQDDTKS